MTKTDPISVGDLWIGIAVSLLLLTILVGIRVVTKGRVEIKLGDFAISIIPFLIFWFITDPAILSLTVNTQGIQIERAFSQAATAQIENDGLIEVNKITYEERGFPGNKEAIENVVKRHPDALYYMLNKDYDPEETKEYLERLSCNDNFKYIILLYENEKLVGVYDWSMLSLYLGANKRCSSDVSREATQLDDTWSAFVASIRDHSEKTLTSLPGFIPAKYAVTENETRKDTLEKMQRGRANWLPVVDADGRLVGVVERSAVVAGLLLEVSNALANEPKAGAPQN